MKIEYDSEGDVLYVRLSRRKAHHVVDVAGARGLAVDVDKDGNVVGIELLYAQGQVDADLRAYDPDARVAPK